jgi:16S rRNA G1207 methylase RsmC
LAAALALTGHAAKATSRLTINLSPEPATNIAASVAEDGVVTAMVVLAITRPRLALVLAILAAVLSVVVVVVLVGAARRGMRRVRARWSA